MSEHKLERFVHEHKKAEIAAAAGLGAAAVSTAAFALWRKQHREARTFVPAAEWERYVTQLKILEEERVRPARVRELLAPVAARIHYATFNTAEQVITRERLQDYFPSDNSPHHLQKALSYLQDRDFDLIGRRPSAMDGRVQGYYSKPALNWAVEYSDCDPLLQAVSELIAQEVE